MYLLEWPDTKVEVLKLRLKEIFLDLEEKTRGATTEELMRKIQDLAKARLPKKSWFQPMQIPAWVRQQIDAAVPAWTYEHVKDGFSGGKAPTDVPILSQEDSVRMWAYAKYVVGREAAKLGLISK